jgi:hypothetical protein
MWKKGNEIRTEYLVQVCRYVHHRGKKTGVGKYSFVNRTIKSWNQLTESLLASFPNKLNTFREMGKKAVTSKGIQVGIGFK